MSRRSKIGESYAMKRKISYRNKEGKLVDTQDVNPSFEIYSEIPENATDNYYIVGQESVAVQTKRIKYEMAVHETLTPKIIDDLSTLRETRRNNSVVKNKNKSVESIINSFITEEEKYFLLGQVYNILTTMYRKGKVTVFLDLVMFNVEYDEGENNLYIY